jgi:hypothetical protein
MSKIQVAESCSRRPVGDATRAIFANLDRRFAQAKAATEEELVYK